MVMQLSSKSANWPINRLIIICLTISVICFIFWKQPKQTGNGSWNQSINFAHKIVNHKGVDHKIVNDKGVDHNEVDHKRVLPPLSNFSTSLTKEGKHFWRSIQPSMQCPAEYLVRAGGNAGFGKWTCGLTKLERLQEVQTGNRQPCLIYSFGVNRDSTWEAEVLVNTHCAVFAYDPTVDSIAAPLRSSDTRVHFEKLGIAGEDLDDKFKLSTFIKKNGHEGRLIHILKIDVEGWEYPVLENLLTEYPEELPFGQLLVEFHVWDWDEEPKRAKWIVDMFTRMEKRGLRLFSVDPDNSDEVHQNLCSEFSFINEKYLDLFID